MKDNILTAQQRADIRNNEKRKGKPCFNQVRLYNQDEKNSIENVIEKHCGTRREALIEAFKLLDSKLG